MIRAFRIKLIFLTVMTLRILSSKFSLFTSILPSLEFKFEPKRRLLQNLNCKKVQVILFTDSFFGVLISFKIIRNDKIVESCF